MADRTATVEWHGTLEEGQGELSLEDSKVLVSTPITWEARVGQAGDRTSPEELLAGAQAACFAMAFSNELAKQGAQPETVRVTATCTFAQRDGAFAVTRMKIGASATVPGMEEEAFRRAVRRAEQGCPVSNAIRGNVEIEVDAALA